MQRTLMLAAVLGLLPTLAPFVVAQEPVDRCARQCDPQAKDVNDPPLRREGPVNVILYAHMEDLLGLGDLNTEPPHPSFERDINRGFIMPSVNTNVPCPVTQCNLHFRNNEFVWQLCPGTIRMTKEVWERNCHVSSLSRDLHVKGPTVHLYWYMSVHAVPNENGSGGLGSVARVGIMPNVAMDARLEANRHANGAGPIIAAGNSEARRITMVTTPTGGPDVYEFMVPMRVLEPLVRLENGTGPLTVRGRAYQFTAGNVAEAMQGDWRVRTGERFPPRLIVPVEAPISIDSVTVRLAEPGRLRVEAAIGHVFGAYDVDQASLALRVEGPSPVSGDAVRPLRYNSRADDHDGVNRPVLAGWEIPLDALSGKKSDYRFHVSARNLQGTYEATGTGDANVVDFSEAKSTPGPPFGVAILVAFATAGAFMAAGKRGPPRKRL